MADTTVSVPLHPAQAAAYDAVVARHGAALATGAFAPLIRAAVQLKQLCTSNCMDARPGMVSGWVQLPGEVQCRVPGAAILDLAPTSRGRRHSTVSGC